MHKSNLVKARSILLKTILLCLIFPSLIFLTAMSNRRSFKKPPELKGGTWFNLQKNQSSLKIKNLKGRVILIIFWTVQDARSEQVIDAASRWYAAYHNTGLEVIGVHVSEFDFFPTQLELYEWIKRKQVLFPVMMDDERLAWRAYEPPFWPYIYLVGREGRLRANYSGTYPLQNIKVMLKTLLEER